MSGIVARGFEAVVQPSAFENKILCGEVGYCRASFVERAIIVGSVFGLGTYLISKKPLTSGIVGIVVGSFSYIAGSLSTFTGY